MYNILFISSKAKEITSPAPLPNAFHVEIIGSHAAI
jgi:hypothetical protein